MRITLSARSTATSLVAAVLAMTTITQADQSNTKEETRTVSSTSSASISVQTNNDESKVTYNGKEVWKGKVKKPVITVAKSIDGNDLAAAFEGKKLLWENVAGAGKQLEDERKKAVKRLKAIGAQ